jgi:hypothetical protein
MGQHPEPEKALGMYLQMFGEPALRQLITRVKAQQQEKGDGLSDSVPAMVDGQEPAALSEGEYVLPSDVVSHLGNGSTEAGASELDALVERVRSERTGTPQPPGQIAPFVRRHRDPVVFHACSVYVSHARGFQTSTWMKPRSG